MGGGGWGGGVLIYTGGTSGSTQAVLVLDDVVGRVRGYDSLRGARIAAAMLTAGDDHQSAAIAHDGDGRYRIYAANVQWKGAVDTTPLHFEHGMPRTASGAMLDPRVWNPADGLVEVRDHVARMWPTFG